MKTFREVTDAEYNAWLANFRDVSTGLASTLGLTPADISSIDGAASSYNSAYSVMLTARMAAKSATTEKTTARRSTENLIATYANKFKANTNVSDAILESLGLPPRGGTPYGPLVAPKDLAVTGDPSGKNILRWKKNGNEGSLFYTVQVRYANSPTWETVAFVENTKFTHTGQTPGVQATYRVFVTRDSVNSDYSNEASVYAGGGNGEADLLAA